MGGAGPQNHPGPQARSAPEPLSCVPGFSGQWSGKAPPAAPGDSSFPRFDPHVLPSHGPGPALQDEVIERGGTVFARAPARGRNIVKAEPAQLAPHVAPADAETVSHSLDCGEAPEVHLEVASLLADAAGPSLPEVLDPLLGHHVRQDTRAVRGLLRKGLEGGFASSTAPA